MNVAWMARALYAAAAVIIATGASALRPQGYRDTLAAAPPVVPTLLLAMPTNDSLLDAVGVVRELDLFRPERSALDSVAAQQLFGNGMAMGGAMPTARPQLVLRGLVGGPILEAIVEGLPGVDGAAVMRTGEMVAGITLRAVRRDTAILVAKDTTWKLTVRRF